MSGFLGAVSSGLSDVSGAISSVASIFGVGPAVQLDSFAFTNFEVPERMRWGGEHSGTLHKLIGGGRRVLDLTGPDEAPIEWSGIFLGPNAKDRARALNALREQGGPYNLDWVGSSQRVWLRNCRFDEGFHQIRYEITCEIIPEDDGLDDDDLGPAGEVRDIRRQDGALSSITGAISDVANTVGPIVGQVTGIVSQVQATGSALLGTVSNVTALASIAGVRLNVGGALAKAESVLTGSTGSLLSGAGGFGSIVNAAGQAASLVGAAGKLSRAATLLGG